MEGRPVEYGERPVTGRSRAPTAGRSACRRAPGSTSCRAARCPARAAGRARGSRRGARRPRRRASRRCPPTRQPSAIPPQTPSPPCQIANGAPPLVGHLVPARGDVVQAGADDPGGDAPDGAAEDEVPVAAAVDPAAAGDPRADRDRGEQREPVHVDRERPELERARAGRGDRREDAHRRRILPRCRYARPFARSSASAASVFSSPARPIPARISGVFVNWISR